VLQGEDDDTKTILEGESSPHSQPPHLPGWFIARPSRRTLTPFPLLSPPGAREGHDRGFLAVRQDADPANAATAAAAAPFLRTERPALIDDLEFTPANDMTDLVRNLAGGRPRNDLKGRDSMD